MPLLLFYEQIRKLILSFVPNFDSVILDCCIVLKALKKRPGKLLRVLLRNGLYNLLDITRQLIGRY